MTGGSFCYLLENRPANSFYIENCCRFSFLPEKLLKYVVRGPFVDGGIGYRPANPVLGVLAFLLAKYGDSATGTQGFQLWIGLLETLCAEAWLHAESMLMRPKLQK